MAKINEKLFLKEFKNLYNTAIELKLFEFYGYQKDWDLPFNHEADFTFYSKSWEEKSDILSNEKFLLELWYDRFITYIKEKIQNFKSDKMGALFTKSAFTSFIIYQVTEQKKYSAEKVSKHWNTILKPNGKKYTIDQVALIYWYQRTDPISNKEMNELASVFGWKSGKKLQQTFSEFGDTSNRLFLSPNEKEEGKRIKQFEEVRDYLITTADNEAIEKINRDIISLNTKNKKPNF